MILIDFSGIAVSNVLMAKMDISESLVRHMILNSIRAYNIKYRQQYGDMVICCDGGSWRKSVFPHYKAGRKGAQEASKIDWAELFRLINLVRDELKEFFPYRVVHVPGAEADDVIATLVETTQEFGQSEPVMIISADHDFIQLQKFSNVRQFSPITKKLISEKDPIQYAREQTLRGCGGDGVPNFMSPADSFVTGTRQKTLSSKRVNQLLENWSFLDKHMTTTEYARWLENQRIINFEGNIPADIKDSIILSFAAPAVNKPNILQYLVSKRCGLLIECAGDFQPRQ